MAYRRKARRWGRRGSFKAGYYRLKRMVNRMKYRRKRWF